jgi:hypothetical protein
VRALDARDVEKSRGVAIMRRQEDQLRYRLKAAFADRARAIAQPLAAFEGSAYRRMRLARWNSS